MLSRICFCEFIYLWCLGSFLLIGLRFFVGFTIIASTLLSRSRNDLGYLRGSYIAASASYCLRSYCPKSSLLFSMASSYFFFNFLILYFLWDSEQASISTTNILTVSMLIVRPIRTQPHLYLASGSGTNSVKMIRPYVLNRVKVSLKRSRRFCFRLENGFTYPWKAMTILCTKTII